MRNVLRSIVSILLALILASCVTGLKMDDIQSIHRGMSHDDFKSKVTRAPDKTFNVENDGIEYSAEVYPMQTGTRAVSVYHWNQYGGYTTVDQVPVFSDYIFVFDPKGLFFWGFMNELQKSDDETVQQLAPKISAAYQKASEQK